MLLVRSKFIQHLNPPPQKKNQPDIVKKTHTCFTKQKPMMLLYDENLFQKDFIKSSNRALRTVYLLTKLGIMCCIFPGLVET